LLSKMKKLTLCFLISFAVLAESDFSWLNGNSRQTEFPLETKYFTIQFIKVTFGYFKIFGQIGNHAVEHSA
ncbi:MAG: hypothetical protein WCK49_08255, partial [Myxococcaceae bacterium]